MRKLLFLFCMLILSFSLSAQKGWECGAGLGVAHYFGDINPHYGLNQPGPGIGIVGRYNFNIRTAMRAQLSYGYLHANDNKSTNNFQRARNLHFRSHTFDLAAVYEFNFLPLSHGSYLENITPYLFAGVSIFSFNPQAKYQGKWVSLAPLGTEGQNDGEEYYKISGSFVFGGGVKYNVSREWTWTFDLMIHKAWTDYIDDVSTVYPDKATLRSRHGQIAVDLSDPSIRSEEYPEIGQAGYQRGSSKEKDAFSIFTIGLTYYFGRIDCPRISEI